MSQSGPSNFAFHYERVLGTSLELQVVATDDAAARRAEEAVLAEVDRVAQILSGYSTTSELARWQEQHGEVAPVSPELAEVLAAAEEWRMYTGGTFNPAAASLVELLRDTAPGADTGPAPDVASRDASVRKRIRELRQPLWTVNRTRGVACRLTHLHVSLDGIAKGYIVDRAATCASAVDGVTQVLVNIGGDLRHKGERPLTVAVADPQAPAENAPPIAVVRLKGESLATSGGYRRGFTMDGREVSHILDPRSGRPASRVISASVIAPDCASADALSTAFSVLAPVESVALADSLRGVGCLMVERDGMMTSNGAWRRHTAAA
jgi:thiamine biosynthesis lipoprotein ApbE